MDNIQLIKQHKLARLMNENYSLVVAYIALTSSPDQVFTNGQLAGWAQANGFEPVEPIPF